MREATATERFEFSFGNGGMVRRYLFHMSIEHNFTLPVAWHIVAAEFLRILWVEDYPEFQDFDVMTGPDGEVF